MAYISPKISLREKEALLIMFGSIWRKKFWALDGQKGRPSISDGIDFALSRLSSGAKEDLVDYVENFLKNMSQRCECSTLKSK
jgi:hypothetical protein